MLGVVEKYSLCFVIIKRYLDGFVRVTKAVSDVTIAMYKGEAYSVESGARKKIECGHC